MKRQPPDSLYYGGEVARQLPGAEIVGTFDLEANLLPRTDHVALVPGGQTVLRWFPQKDLAAHLRKVRGRLDEEQLLSLATEAHEHFDLLQECGIETIPHRSFVRPHNGQETLFTTAPLWRHERQLSYTNPAGLATIDGLASYLTAIKERSIPRLLDDIYRAPQYRRILQDTDPSMSSSRLSKTTFLRQLVWWHRRITKEAPGHARVGQRLEALETSI